LKQFLITPSAGKRLIAKALAKHPTVQNTLRNGTLVIIAGTTNGYIAEEILRSQQTPGFSRKHFFRGIIIPPNKPITAERRMPDESNFPGDVVIVKGVWQKGKTIDDVIDSLKEDDMIIKGANALNMERKQAAVLIGHPKAGTLGLTLPAVVGRRVKLMVTVGLEKRVTSDLFALSQKLNEPGSTGYRLWPVQGEIFTELDAVKLLTGADTQLMAAGGVCGAEGSCWLLVAGTKEQENSAAKLFAVVTDEPAFGLDML
jgi:hypothetical protein